MNVQYLYELFIVVSFHQMLKNAYIKGTTRAHKKLIIMVLIPSSNNKRKKPFMLVVGPPNSLVINNKNSLKFVSTTK